MNWIHFLIWVAGIYVLYYLVNILIDVAGSKRSPAAKSLSHELTFSENVQPKQLSPEAADSKPTGKSKADSKMPAHSYEQEMIASGGVSITDLFRLAKQEAIIYTHSVSF